MVVAMDRRITLALEPDLRARAEQAAKQEGVNLSEFVRAAIIARLEPR